MPKAALWKFFADDGLFMARGLAFSLLIYCIPLSLLTVSGLSYTLASSDTALRWVRRLAQVLMPQFRDDFSQYLGSIISNRGLLSFAGFIAFIFVSSTTFGSLRLVLNKVFGATESRGILHGKAMEVVMMLATSLTFFVVITLVYGVTLVQGVVLSLSLTRRMLSGLSSEFPALYGYLHPAAIFFTGAGSFAATIGLFWFLYRVPPAKAPRAKSLLVGALSGAALFEISKVAFAWYIRSAEGTTALYGTFSALIFFFLWLYYACAVFVFGAEVSAVVERRARAAAPSPKQVKA